MASLAEIYDWFMTGKKPTQAQFWASWGSFWNKNESIPQSAVSGLTSVLNAKAENDQFNAHKGANDAHAALFLAKEDKTQKGAPNGYAPLDEFTKLAAQYLNIVNDLVTGGATALLSAEQGKVLQNQVSAINTLLTSDNVNLDTVQELVDAIETVQMSLSTILVNDLTSGGTTKALTAEMGKQLDLIKESTANKSTSFVVDYLSDIKFPSVKAVYDFCMSAFKKKFLDFGDVTGIAHTFGKGSENTMYKFSNNNPITATIPTNATTPFEIGTVFETIAIGNGVLTVTGAPGVTILTNLSNTSVKNEVRRYTKIDTDTWSVEGNQAVSGAKTSFTVFIDTVNGSDMIGRIEDSSKPFKTTTSAIAALPEDNGSCWTFEYIDSSTRLIPALPNRSLILRSKNSGIFLFSQIVGELSPGPYFEIDAPRSSLSIVLNTGLQSSMRPTSYLKLNLFRITLSAFHSGFFGFFGTSSLTVDSGYINCEEFIVDSTQSGIRVVNIKGNFIARKFICRAPSLQMINNGHTGVRYSFYEVNADTQSLTILRSDPTHYYKTMIYSGSNAITEHRTILDVTGVSFTCSSYLIGLCSMLTGKMFNNTFVIQFFNNDSVSNIINFEGRILQRTDIANVLTIKNSTLYIQGVFINGAGFMVQNARVLNIIDSQIIQDTPTHLFTFQNASALLLPVNKYGFFRSNATTLVNPSTIAGTGINLIDRTPNNH